MLVFLLLLMPRLQRRLTLTLQALMFQKRQLLFGSQRLRIVAPDAAKRATFEKNRGADARPIMDAKFLDVENEGHRHLRAFFVAVVSAAFGWLTTSRRTILLV